MGVLAARRQRNIRVVIAVTLVLLLAIAGALMAVLRPWNDLAAFRHGGLTTSAPPAAPAHTPKLGALPSAAPAPTAASLNALLAPLAGNPALGAFSGVVSDASNGVVLWSATPDRPMVPASVTKVLTTAAALLRVPADHRLTTTVVRGSAPNELVLVGGGDPTLTVLPADRKGLYPGAARLDDLVAQVRRSGVTGIDTVLVDTSAYSGPTMAQGWSPADIGGGNIAPIEPVMLDGGRVSPTADDSPRSATPALDVGRVLAQRLGVNPGAVRHGSAPTGATTVASVKSAPLRDRLSQLMRRSDNVLAEAVGREVAVASGQQASFVGADIAVISALTEAGLRTDGVTLHDSSGLSSDNRIPAVVLDGVLSSAAGDAKPQLRPMLDYLPVAGATGTLADRYGVHNRAAAGWVRAKTGTLSVASALVGYVVDESNRVLTFALMSNGSPPEASRPALDAIASALRSCGCQ